MKFEQKILLSILGARADGEIVKKLKQLSADEWTVVIQEADRHGVTPLLFTRIKEDYSSISLPPDIERTLREKYLHSSGSGIRLYDELSNVLAHLQNDGIEAIILKGPHLAEGVYANRAVRPMNDIDILIRRNDLSIVGEKLEGIGYAPSRDFFVEAESAVHADFPAYSKPGATGVEIHWTLESPESPFRIDPEGLWKRAQPIEINGTKTQGLSNEDLLLHLCIHTAFHHRLTFGLIPFCDIKETLERFQNKIDWELFISRAYEWRAEKCVYLALFFARELMGADLPQNVLKELEPDKIDSTVLQIAQEQIFSEAVGSLPMTYNIARVMGGHPIKERLLTLLRAVFPSRELMATKYPVHPSSKRIYLYYPIRLKDLFSQYGCTVWRLSRRDKEAMESAEREERGNQLVDWMSN